MSQNHEQPSIVVFLTDDHGIWASPWHGGDFIAAPSLRSLASSGAVIRNAYCTSPVCSPARASFWTGLMPSGHGVHDHLAYANGETEHPGVSDQRTLADSLQAAGYTTALCGKWQCSPVDPPPSGFDWWFASLRGTNARFSEQSFLCSDSRSGLPARRVEWHGHQSPRVVDSAIEFIRAMDPKKPFYLHVELTNTHTPHNNEPKRWRDHYANVPFSVVPQETDSGVHGQVRYGQPSDPDAARGQIIDYCAAVSVIDEQVGRVLDELESRRLLDDVLIVYASDHGHMNGRHGLHTKGNATIPQNLLDDAIRVPMAISWPSGGVRSGTLLSHANHIDLHLTLRDAAGLDPCIASADERYESVSHGDHTYVPFAPEAAGHSLLSALRDGSTMNGSDWGALSLSDDGDPYERPLFVEYGNARMIRRGQYKLIVRYPGPNGHFPDELYDMRSDPSERKNIIGVRSHDKLIGKLKEELDRFFAQHSRPGRSGAEIVQIPTHNPSEPWRVDAWTRRTSAAVS